MADPGEKRETSVDRLYALPLAEFTGARDELARRLKRQGDGEGGAAVKRLRKPTVAAWALNQARRRHPRPSEQLLEVGRRLREAQEKLLAGGGREPLHRAVAEERRLVGELAQRAERELAAAGHPVSAALREKLRATLHAAAGDPEAREGLATGRLVRDHEASGLGPLTGAGIPSSRPPARRPSGRGPTSRAPTKGAAGGRPRKPAARPAASAPRRDTRRTEKRLERARARARELDQKSAEAGRRVRAAEAEAARAASALERARASEQRARDRAERSAADVADLERTVRG